MCVYLTQKSTTRQPTRPSASKSMVFHKRTSAETPKSIFLFFHHHTTSTCSLNPFVLHTARYRSRSHPLTAILMLLLAAPCMCVMHAHIPGISTLLRVAQCARHPPPMFQNASTIVNGRFSGGKLRSYLRVAL